MVVVVVMMITFFPTQNSCRVSGSLEKYGRARQATDDNIRCHRKDVICILEYWGQNTDIHIIFTATYFSTVTAVTQMQLYVT